MVPFNFATAKYTYQEWKIQSEIYSYIDIISLR